jgi:hypothetical protein
MPPVTAQQAAHYADLGARLELEALLDIVEAFLLPTIRWDSDEPVVTFGQLAGAAARTRTAVTLAATTAKAA